MASAELAAVVLAAGSGRRLAPLTSYKPKALCPVANVAMLDHAIASASRVTTDIAVNARHMASQIEDHANGRFIVRLESGEALGTAGGVANLKDWIDGRNVLICNSDAWHRADLAEMLHAWDGERPMLLTTLDEMRPDFDGRRFIGASLMPWTIVSRLEPKPSGLWEVCWRERHERGGLTTFDYDGAFYDCGTPIDYLEANLAVAQSRNVVGQGARIEGSIDRCVVWPGAHVRADESLQSCIRISDELTVYVPMTELGAS